MKNRILLILGVLTMFFVIGSFQPANGQNPTVTINYNASGLIPGSTIQVPVVINGTNVGNWQMFINYDRDVLTYQSATHTVTGLGFFGLDNNNTSLGYPALKASLAYTGGQPGYTYNNQAVITITFTYNGGATLFSFINIATNTSQTGNIYTYLKTYTNPPATTNLINLNTVYTGGMAAGQLHSKAAGGAWRARATWIENIKPNSMCDIFIMGNEVSIDSTAACAKLQIESTGRLTLTSTKTLAVAGNLTIKSDAAGTGSYIDPGTGTTIGGTKYVERYLTGSPIDPPSSRTWHNVIPPVGGATANTFLNGLLNTYYEPTQTWMAIVPETTPMPASEGYEVAMPSTGTYTYVGTSLNTGDYTFSGLTKTALVPETYAGFHLVGNIYPSSLAHNTTWEKTNLYSSIYVWDPTAGSYVTHNGTLGTGNMADGILAPGQGFFVANNGPIGTLASIKIPNSLRQHNSKAFIKEEVPEVVRLRVDGNEYYDEMVVHFDANATIGFDDNYDAFKMGSSSGAPMLYSIIPGDHYLSINVLPSRQTCMQVPLGFVAAANGTYSITASDLGSFPVGTPVQLEDVFTGSLTDLNATPTYAFEASVGAPEHRFNLWFSPLGIVPGDNATNISIYANDHTVFVNVPFTSQGRIMIYNILGNEIANQAIQSNTLNKVNLTVPAGYYIVKVVDNNHSVSRKVFIN